MKPYFATAKAFGGEKMFSGYFATADEARNNLMGQAFCDTKTIAVFRLTF